MVRRHYPTLNKYHGASATEGATPLLLISKMGCSHDITGGRGWKKKIKKTLGRRVEPKHLHPSCTCVHAFKNLCSPGGQNRKPTRRNIPSFLWAPDVFTPWEGCFSIGSVGKLLPCPSHDTLTERHVHSKGFLREEERLKTRRGDTFIHECFSANVTNWIRACASGQDEWLNIPWTVCN